MIFLRWSLLGARATRLHADQTACEPALRSRGSTDRRFRVSNLVNSAIGPDLVLASTAESLWDPIEGAWRSGSLRKGSPSKSFCRRPPPRLRAVQGHGRCGLSQPRPDPTPRAGPGGGFAADPSIAWTCARWCGFTARSAPKSRSRGARPARRRPLVRQYSTGLLRTRAGVRGRNRSGRRRFRRPQPRLRIDGQLPVRAQDPRRVSSKARAPRGKRLRTGPPAVLSRCAGCLPTTQREPDPA